MAGTALLIFVACASALQVAPNGKPWEVVASGDDGRIRVAIVVYLEHREVIAPGETLRMGAYFTTLADGPLSFPQGNHQPLSFLYVRQPSGEIVVYPGIGGDPQSARQLGVDDYRRALVLEKNRNVNLLYLPYYRIPMVNGAPGWRDLRTMKPIEPNFRAEGVYEAWVRYSIPKVDGAPDDAWHGTVETERVRFTVREIPVSERRPEATAEQIAHLEAYMEWVEDRVSSDYKAKPRLPDTVEMPPRFSLERRVEWALQRTENEGFARHVVALLREHQPKENNQTYPPWWGSLSRFVQQRVYLYDYRQKSLGIIGPCLDEYAAIAAIEIERQLTRLPFSTGGAYLDFLLDYVKYKPSSPVRGRLEVLARRFAKIPVDAKPRDPEVRGRLVYSWASLFALGILRDEMLFAEAKRILGEPTMKKEDVVGWNYTTGTRKAQFGITGKLVGDDELKIIFTNRDERYF